MLQSATLQPSLSHKTSHTYICSVESRDHVSFLRRKRKRLLVGVSTAAQQYIFGPGASPSADSTFPGLVRSRMVVTERASKLMGCDRDLGKLCSAFQVESRDHLQDLLAAMVLSECVYKRLEMNEEGLAQRIADYLALYPQQYVELNAVQCSSTEVSQNYMLATNDKTMYVAFMGTKRARDLIIDVNYLHEAIWSGSSGMLDEQAPTAHRGFLSRAREIDVARLYNLAKAQGKRLVLCGHSLGGAVAKLCTLQLLHELPEWPRPDVHCICFATPAVGNDALANMVQAAGWDRHFSVYYLPEDQVMRLISFAVYNASGDRAAPALPPAADSLPLDNSPGTASGQQRTEQAAVVGPPAGAAVPRAIGRLRAVAAAAAAGLSRRPSGATALAGNSDQPPQLTPQGLGVKGPRSSQEGERLTPDALQIGTWAETHGGQAGIVEAEEGVGRGVRLAYSGRSSSAAGRKLAGARRPDVAQGLLQLRAWQMWAVSQLRRVQVVPQYHAFGNHWYLYPNGVRPTSHDIQAVVPSGVEDSLAAPSSLSSTDDDQPKGPFGFHRMLSYRMRSLQVLEAVLQASSGPGSSLGPASGLPRRLDPTQRHSNNPNVALADIFPRVAAVTASARLPVICDSGAASPVPEDGQREVANRRAGGGGVGGALGSTRRGPLALLPGVPKGSVEDVVTMDVMVEGANLQLCTRVRVQVLGQTYPAAHTRLLPRDDPAAAALAAVAAALPQGTAAGVLAPLTRALRAAAAAVAQRLPSAQTRPEHSHSATSAPPLERMLVQVNLPRQLAERLVALRAGVGGGMGMDAAAGTPAATVSVQLCTDFQQLEVGFVPRPHRVGVLGTDRNAAALVHAALSGQLRTPAPPPAAGMKRKQPPPWMPAVAWRMPKLPHWGMRPTSQSPPLPEAVNRSAQLALMDKEADSQSTVGSVGDQKGVPEQPADGSTLLQPQGHGVGRTPASAGVVAAVGRLAMLSRQMKLLGPARHRPAPVNMPATNSIAAQSPSSPSPAAGGGGGASHTSAPIARGSHPRPSSTALYRRRAAALVRSARLRIPLGAAAVAPALLRGPALLVAPLMRRRRAGNAAAAGPPAAATANQAGGDGPLPPAAPAAAASLAHDVAQTIFPLTTAASRVAETPSTASTDSNSVHASSTPMEQDGQASEQASTHPPSDKVDKQLQLNMRSDTQLGVNPEGISPSVTVKAVQPNVAKECCVDDIYTREGKSGGLFPDVASPAVPQRRLLTALAAWRRQPAPAAPSAAECSTDMSPMLVTEGSKQQCVGESVENPAGSNPHQSSSVSGDASVSLAAAMTGPATRSIIDRPHTSVITADGIMFELLAPVAPPTLGAADTGPYAPSWGAGPAAWLPPWLRRGQPPAVSAPLAQLEAAARSLDCLYGVPSGLTTTPLAGPVRAMNSLVLGIIPPLQLLQAWLTGMQGLPAPQGIVRTALQPARTGPGRPGKTRSAPGLAASGAWSAQAPPDVLVLVVRLPHRSSDMLHSTAWRGLLQRLQGLADNNLNASQSRWMWPVGGTPPLPVVMHDPCAPHRDVVLAVADLARACRTTPAAVPVLSTEPVALDGDPAEKGESGPLDRAMEKGGRMWLVAGQWFVQQGEGINALASAVNRALMPSCVDWRIATRCARPFGEGEATTGLRAKM